jgi:hypothetical protein
MVLGFVSPLENPAQEPCICQAQIGWHFWIWKVQYRSPRKLSFTLGGLLAEAFGRGGPGQLISLTFHLDPPHPLQALCQALLLAPCGSGLNDKLSEVNIDCDTLRVCFPGHKAKSEQEDLLFVF